MNPNLNTYFLYHHSLHSNVTKTQAISQLGAHLSLTTNQEPSQVKALDAKLGPFFSNTVKISGPNLSVKVTDHFICISTNVIQYRITCTLCKKIYIGETGRRLAERFRKRLRDAEQNNTDASKTVAYHFNLPNHSHHNMTICGLSLHHGNTESRKNLEQKFIFQLGTLSLNGINERVSCH